MGNVGAQTNFRFLQRCSNGFKSGLWLGHSRTKPRYQNQSFDILIVFVLLKDELLPESKVKVKAGCRVPVWPIYQTGVIRGLCKDGFPSGMFSSVSTEEPWCSDRVAIRFLVTSLPFSPIAQIRWSASSQKTVLLVLNFFQICASKQSSIRGRQIILTSCLVFILTYTVNFGNVKKGVCLSKSYPIN